MIPQSVVRRFGYSKQDFALILAMQLADARFEESEHPRGHVSNKGRFRAKGASEEDEGRGIADPEGDRKRVVALTAARFITAEKETGEEGGGSSKPSVSEEKAKEPGMRSDGSKISMFVSDEAKAAVDAGLSTLPQEHIDAFSGVIESSKTPIDSAAARAAGAEGIGGFKPGVIVLYDKVKNIDDTLRHEFGHAMDYYLTSKGWAPSDSVGRDMRAEAAKMTKAEARRAEYYTTDKRELFAELYAAAFAPDDSKSKFFGGMKRARVLELFPMSIEKIRKVKKP